MREKDPTEYNGWETYVAAKMAANDTSFMPRNTAMILQASRDREQAAVAALNDRLAEVDVQNKQILQMLDSLQRDNAAIMEHLGTKSSRAPAW